jgi:hypothetical protein
LTFGVSSPGKDNGQWNDDDNNDHDDDNKADCKAPRPFDFGVYAKHLCASLPDLKVPEPEDRRNSRIVFNRGEWHGRMI